MVRDGLDDWLDTHSGSRLRLFFDEGNSLVAVVAYCDLVEDQPERGFFIYLLAVEADWQGQQIGLRIATGLIRAMAAERPDGRVLWMVDPRNTASASLSDLLGCDEPCYDENGMLAYHLELREESS
ncbi:GNAT family N-acetyltransferase [Janibacter massiliensis]|uniref:GNAT family N-acetyltransferase n=1 Tax=Janibacter massiliensis TaxID=2058291 RepID=UPI000D0FA19B|nr:GNAT family N-acetyltransferase [Janibacter massiliensis]